MKKTHYYEAKDVVYPVKPNKPRLKSDHTSEEAFEYAKEMQKYEELLKAFKVEEKKYVNIRKLRFEEFKRDVKEEYAPEYSDERWEIVYAKAWDDGHSDGLYSVINRVEELIDFLDDLNI